MFVIVLLASPSELAELLPRRIEARFHLRCRNPEGRGDLVIGQVREMTKHHDFPVFRRERQQRHLDGLLTLSDFHWIGRRDPTAYPVTPAGTAVRARRTFKHSFFRIRNSQLKKRCSGSKAVQMLVRLDERVLSRIPRVLVVAEHSERDVEQPPLIAGHDGFVRVRCPPRHRAMSAASSVSSIKYTPLSRKLVSLSHHFVPQGKESVRARSPRLINLPLIELWRTNTITQQSQGRFAA